jgi:hypothetical protein
MADIAVAFHWPPSELDKMSLTEIQTWHQLAVERTQRT